MRGASRYAVLTAACLLAGGLPLVVPLLEPAGRNPVPVQVSRIALAGIDPQGLAEGPPAGRRTRIAGTRDGVRQAADETVALEPAVATARIDTQEFGLVGVTSDEPLDPVSAVMVRVREDGAWGDWVELPVSGHGPDSGSLEAADARYGTEPLLTGEADGVQVRIDTPDGSVPDTTQLVLLDNPVTPDDASLGTTLPMSSASAAVAQPPIISRAQWGADESKRGHEPYYSDTIKVAFVHHTTSSSTYSMEEAAQEMRNLYGWYTDGLNYSDMAYNFLVDRFGRLYEGRAGGVALPVIGGHTAGFNQDTFAVSAIGNFDTFNPPAADMAKIRESISRLIAWKLSLYHRDPLGSTTLVSDFGGGTSLYEPGEVAKTTVIAGHGEIGSTACPGRYLFPQLPLIRQRAATLQGAAFFSPAVGTPKPAWGSGLSSTVRTTTRRALTWQLEVRSACDAVVRRITGRQEAPGALAIPWDLRDAKGRAVPPGSYRLSLTGSDAAGAAVPWQGAVTVAAAPGAPADPCDPPEEFRVSGDGYGHGVGLSQWGAYAMARAGWTAPKIMRHYFPTSTISPAADDITIRVGLLHQVGSLQLRSQPLPGATGTAPIKVAIGKADIIGDRRDVFGFALSSDGSVTVTRTRGGSTTTVGAGKRVRVMWAGTRDAGTLGTAPTVVNVIGPGEAFSGQHHTYRYGSIFVAPVDTSEGTRLTAVNEMLVRDEYLRGIAEVTASWPAAALQSQAIAARSYAISAKQAGQRSSCRCHVDDGGGPYYDQTYWGYDREYLDTGERWVAAVDATETSPTDGQVLLYDGTVVRAPYTASTGGRTRTAGEVWGGSYAWSVSVDDSWSLKAPGNPYNDWVRVVPQADMADAFGLGDVMSVKITEVAPSGVPAVIQATSSTGRKATLSGSGLRSAFGLLSSYVSDISWDQPVAARTSVTASFRPSGEIAEGSNVTVSGTLAPATAGLTVRRQLETAAGWKTLATTTTGSKGAYSFTIRGIASAGKVYRYRIVVSGSKGVVAVSPIITIKVV